MIDPFRVLEIPRTGVMPTEEEIRSAFRRASLECHPDRFPGDAEKAQRYTLLTQSYQILMDCLREGGKLDPGEDILDVLFRRAYGGPP